ncbi:MAG: TRAP transporter small permease subunit [Burkholderiales bacterium]|nr:TRAP transporter small permease subunit [Burkholderiales bacterium]
MKEAIERAVDLVGRATSWLALVIVVLMAVNVVLRYTLSYGSVWAQELEWHLLVPLIMFGIPFALLKGDHVRVDVLFEKFSRRNQVLVDIASQVLGIAIAALFFWLCLAYVQQSFAINETSSDPGGLAYRWALKALLPAGFLLLALQSFATLLGDLAKLRAPGREGGE